ncbi:MAG: extracellular solute-binding protein [Deinococcales bacterium]
MKSMRISLAIGLLTFMMGALAQTTITYWQYDFAARIEAMNQLIAQFEAENPDIKVVQETFPYDSYQAQVGASLPAGIGADVVQLYYGWLPAWIRAGYVQPLPAEHFDVASIESEFIPMVQAAKYQGEYYGLPTAVRSLALFYNKDKLKEAGFEAAPATWDEFITIAKALTEKRGPRFNQVGYGIAPNGQDHHLLREILVRQFGGMPYSEDGSMVEYNSDAGLEAFKFYTSWTTEHEIGVPEFIPGNNGYREGFQQQQNIAMIIDGSFAIGGVRSNAQFDWGVAEIPTLDNGVQANFGSFWLNGLSSQSYEDAATLKLAQNSWLS